MTSLKFRFSGISVLVLGLMSAFFFTGVPSVYAERIDATQVTSKLTELDNRLTRIEKDQKRILENQDEILKQIQNLKIWVRRN